MEVTSRPDHWLPTLTSASTNKLVDSLDAAKICVGSKTPAIRGCKVRDNRYLQGKEGKKEERAGEGKSIFYIRISYYYTRNRTSLSSWSCWLLKYVFNVSFDPQTWHFKHPLWKKVKSLSGPTLSTGYTVLPHRKHWFSYDMGLNLLLMVTYFAAEVVILLITDVTW